MSLNTFKFHASGVLTVLLMVVLFASCSADDGNARSSRR